MAERNVEWVREWAAEKIAIGAVPPTINNHARKLKIGESLYRMLPALAALVDDRDALNDDTVRLHRLATDRFEEIIALKAENARMREALMDCTASLVAAVSLLERTPNASKAAPSDKMFAQMIKDYSKSIACARAALTQPSYLDPTEGDV